MKMHRCLILLAALTAVFSAHADLASLFSNAAPAVPLAQRPSIIVIQCHELARGDLSCYGQTNFQTPNLDALARAGIRFTDYNGGADSAATTALLLGGKKSAFVSGQANLAQRLRQSGYRTGLIGEWGLPGKPWEQGFDEFAGFLQDAEGRDYFADGLWRYAPNSILDPTNNQMQAYIGREMIYPNTDGKKGKYLPELFVNAMNNFVRINQPDTVNHFRPFFLLVNFPAPRSASAGADDFPVPTDAPFTGEAWLPTAKNRAALITRLDAGIGRLFEQLDKSGLTNNCAVFFASSSAPGKFKDARLNSFLPPEDFCATTNPTPRLPMIVKWPEKIPGGRVSGKKWTAADFAPTALAMASAKPATNFTGTSILPALLGKVEQP
jgi:arylsulfatase A-like enzyme